MIKTCEKCQKPFSCRADDIAQCHCVSTPLSAEILEKISVLYSNCLCEICLIEIKNELAKD